MDTHAIHITPSNTLGQYVVACTCRYVESFHELADAERAARRHKAAQ